MIEKIYSIFYNKLPMSMEDIMPSYDRCKLVTCLNAYYMVKLKYGDYRLYQ